MSKEINALVDDLIAIATSLFVDGNQEACTNFVDELKLFKEEKNSFKKEKLRSQENSHLMVCPLAWLRKNAVEKILSEMTTRRTVVNLIYEVKTNILSLIACTV